LFFRALTGQLVAHYCVAYATRNALSELSQALGHKISFESIPQVFNAMALEAKAFTGISFDKIGSFGIELTKNIKDPGKKVVPEMTAI